MTGLAARVCWSLLAGLVLLAADPAGGEVRVGAITPLSGALSTYGVSGVQGARLALEEINRERKIPGGPLVLIDEDDASKQGESATIARKLIFSDHVVAILGGLTSSETLEAAPIAQSAQIPLLSPTATNLAVTQVGDFVFRTCFTDPFIGLLMSKFAAEHLHAKTAVILVDVKQDYSIGVADGIDQSFTQSGGKILDRISFSSGDLDYRAQLTAARARHPDVLFLPAYYTEAGLILREARQLGIQSPFIGADGWDSPVLLQVAGTAANGCYYANHFSADDPNPAVQEFVKKYKAAYGATPDALAALWYDGMRLLADAIVRAGSTESALLRSAIANTTGFEGITGKISLDPQRNASKPGVIIAIENQQLKVAQRVSP